MKRLYGAIIIWSLLMIIPTITAAEGSLIKNKYRYASLFFLSVGIKADDKIHVRSVIDYDEGTNRNISLMEKGSMNEIGAELCRKMAEQYSGIKPPSEEWSKMKILNMLGGDGWEIVPFYYKDDSDGGLTHIEGYFLKKELQ